MTTDDYPHSAHAQFDKQLCENTLMTTRAQMGRRTYDGCLNKQQAPSVGRHYLHRHGFMNIPEVGHTGLTQKDTLNNQPNNSRGKESRIENEVMDGSYEQEFEQVSEADSGITEKETRGPTYMQSVLGRHPNLPRYHVE